VGRQNKVVDKHIWKDIWKLIEQDVSTAVATYMIVAVYCVVCAQSYGGQEASILQQQIRQLVVDSVVPTTITLVMTGIIQIFFTTTSHKRNFFHVFSLIGMMTFAMLTAGCRPLDEVSDLICVILGSIVIVVLDIGMLIEERMLPDTRLGVSGRKD